MAGGRRIGLHVGLEQSLLRVRVDADTGVDHFKAEAVGADQFYAEANTAVAGELEGVADEVGKDLAQPNRVAKHEAWQFWVGVVDEIEFAGACDRPIQATNAIHQSGQIEDHLFQLQSAGFDLGHVEHLRHQVGHFLATDDDLVDVAVADRVIEVWRTRQFGHTEDAIERSAQFVVDGGEELGLRVIGVALALGQGFGRFTAIAFEGVAIFQHLPVLALQALRPDNGLLGEFAFGDVRDHTEHACRPLVVFEHAGIGRQPVFGAVRPDHPELAMPIALSGDHRVLPTFEDGITLVGVYGPVIGVEGPERLQAGVAVTLVVA